MYGSLYEVRFLTYILSILFFGIMFPASGAQPTIPNKLCQYDRIHAVLRRVKKPTNYQLDMTYHPQSSDLRYTFSPGTVVSVSSQQDGWACVYGSKFTSSGWKGFSGWIPVTQLEEPAEESHPSK